MKELTQDECIELEKDFEEWLKTELLEHDKRNKLSVKRGQL